MEIKTLFFSKVRDVKSPNRGTPKSAGIDFFIPVFNEQFINDIKIKNTNISSIMPGSYIYYITDTKILLSPGARILIPSGIKMKGHENIALIAFNKSGIASKKGLSALACIVDEDYEGELHINVVNTSSNIVEICENEKLIQFLEIHVDYSTLNEMPLEELFTNSDSQRGEGAFGSTGK